MGPSRRGDYIGRNIEARGASADTEAESIALDLLADCRNGIISGKIHISAVRSYEKLLLVLENTEYAADIARLVKMHPRDARTCSLKIIDLLLFNSRKNPFISLGLPENADGDTVHRRWKRLMVLFHPDRPAARMLDVKRTKMINVAYQRIREFYPKNSSVSAEAILKDSYRGRAKTPLERIVSHAGQTLAESTRIGRKYIRKAFYAINDLAGNVTNPRRASFVKDEAKYLRYIPSIIVLLTAFTAIVMLSIYILQSLFSITGGISLGE